MNPQTYDNTLLATTSFFSFFLFSFFLREMAHRSTYSLVSGEDTGGQTGSDPLHGPSQTLS
jgi:hypothetical protein